MTSRASIIRTAAAVAVCALFAGPAGAQTIEEPRQLVISIYKNEAAAREAMKTLKAARDRGEVSFDSYALVAMEANGKVKIRERRAKGTLGGQAVAAVGGLLGVRTGLGVGSNAASATDYLTSNVVGMPTEVVQGIKGALHPGQAALVSAADQRHATVAEKAQEVGAERVLTHKLPYSVVQDDFREPSEPIPAPQSVPGSP